MLVGQQFGPFTIDKELGSGAMGTVYRGRYTKTGQIMAIKIMSPSIGSTNAAALDRFEREITILKQLNHPNIVRFYGAGKQSKMRYFAMEYIEGESLDKVIARRGRMTWEEVVVLGKQLCAALQHAHEKGIIHRDLKPSNIMVLADETLKLTDFGIAKDMDLDGLTATNCTVGTAAYMSPEQCKGQTDLTAKSDLYSLGVLFYELLTGRKPFKADNAMEMFMQHVQGTFERTSRQVLDIPVWLDTLVCQLLEKKPEQRPLDASMVSNVLGTIQEKVEAQQSAGVEAVRRRVLDRAPGQKRLGEEDKDAARMLMTGKSRPKRKPTKKPIHEQTWLRAVGLLLLLAFAGTMIWLVFRPASPDKLYQQAARLMKSGNEEEAEKIIGKYRELYPDLAGKQTEQMLAWRDQIELNRGEEKIRQLHHMRNKSLPYPPQQGEEKPFAAAEAEEEGDVEKARRLWQEIKSGASHLWSLTAEAHLLKLQKFDRQDEAFARTYATINESGEEPSLEGRSRLAFLGWRAKHFGDEYKAKQLFATLKETTTQKKDATVDDEEHFWHLYAAWKIKQWADSAAEHATKGKDDSIALAKQRFEEDVMKPYKDPNRIKPMRDLVVTCLDILALYAKDEPLQSLVERARKMRDQINQDLGR